MFSRFLKNHRKMHNINTIIQHVGGGVFKRIDENRELLELMQKEAPEFLKKHSWVYLWIDAQDNFLTELAKAAEIRPLQGHEPRNYTID